jgi:hypothetical protein
MAASIFRGGHVAAAAAAADRLTHVFANSGTFAHQNKLIPPPCIWDYSASQKNE